MNAFIEAATEAFDALIELLVMLRCPLLAFAFGLLVMWWSLG